MTANILKQNIANATAEIKNAKTECWRAEQEARATCARAIVEPEKYIESLIVQHSERAQELAVLTSLIKSIQTLNGTPIFDSLHATVKRLNRGPIC